MAPTSEEIEKVEGLEIFKLKTKHGIINKGDMYNFGRMENIGVNNNLANQGLMENCVFKVLFIRVIR